LLEAEPRTILGRNHSIDEHRGCAIVRRLGVAAVSAALIGTIAAVVPAGMASADVSGTTLPDPIADVCAAAGSTGCWRYTSIQDIPAGPLGPLPVAQGSTLQLTPASTPWLASAAWYNTPISIQGKAIEASYTAYIDSAASATVHRDGLAFALIEGHLPESDVGNNQPAPVPFPANPLTGVEYGAGGNGLGFSGFDGDTGNTDGRKNLGVVLTTSADDANNGGDQLFNANRVGLLKGQAWPLTNPPGPGEQDPHVRTGRWYGGSPQEVAPSIYGLSTNARPVRMGVQLVPVSAGVWHAKVTVDGTLKLDANVNLPNTVYFGFTAGTGEFPQRHAISDVTIKYGTLSAPTVSANPGSVNFGTVTIGQTSTQNVVLKNNSALPVGLTAAQAPGFSVTGLPATLDAGASTTVQASFTPSAAGSTVNGTFTINVTGPDGTSATPIALTGVGSTVAPPVTGGAPYNAVTPDRILDTRTSGGPIGPNGVRSVKVTGAKGVPEGAGAVVLNVTVTQPTETGYITVYPTGTTPPTASSLNFVAGQDVANLVTAKVGTNGQVDIYNFAGDTQVLFDVVGWFPASLASSPATLAAEATQGGQFVPLVPERILDTRNAIGASAPLAANSSLDLQVTGRGGVPADGVAAVVMNLTGTNTTAPGYLTAWPTGTKQQTTSNLNFGPGQSVPNLAVVPVGTGGKVSIYNFDGTTDVLADVVGYYTASGVTVAGGGLFHAMSPVRFLDTRQTGGTLGTDITTTLAVSGVHGVPADAVGLVMNVTATNTSDAGFLTVFPVGAARPTTSNLNFVAGQTVPNLVMSKLGTGGAVNIYNFAGSTDVIADVVGWYGPT
jgi:hypothetical protein